MKKIVLILSSCLLASSCAQKSLTIDLSRDLITKKLGFSAKGMRAMQDMHSIGLGKAEYIRSQKQDENLSFAIITMPKHEYLDVTIVHSPGTAKRLGTILAADRTRSGSSLVKGTDISDITFLEESPSRVKGQFLWRVPGVLNGRCLFVAEKASRKWALTFMGIPRKSSNNLTHCFTILPRYSGPYRSALIFPVEVPNTCDASIAPTNDWHFLNIAASGAVPVSDEPSKEVTVRKEDIISLFTQDELIKESIILRCDRESIWGYVDGAIKKLRNLGVQEFWYAVETTDRGERFLLADTMDVVRESDNARMLEIDKKGVFCLDGSKLSQAELIKAVSDLPPSQQIIVVPTRRIYSQYVLTAVSLCIEAGKTPAILLCHEQE